MFFIGLLALTTFAIAGSAAAFSVYGLANIFAGAFWSVVIMGASLEAGKLIAASFLYRYWDTLNFLMKTYLFSAIIVLMVITSMGIFGFLSAGYQQDTLPLKEMQAKVKLFDDRKAELEELKQERIKQRSRLDAQVDAIPGNHSTNRRKMRESQKEERTQIDIDLKRYALEIQQATEDQHKLKTKVIHQEVHTGPIVYIAKSLGTEVDDATKWVVFALIIVFDPLAVVLTIGVNIALAQRGIGRKQVVSFADVTDIDNASIDELKEELQKLDTKRASELTEVEQHYKNLIESILAQPDKRREIIRDIRTTKNPSQIT